MALLNECTLGNFVLGTLPCGMIPQVTAYLDSDDDGVHETSISQYISGISLTRGIDPELGSIMAASALLRFRNQDGRFSPKNSLYYTIRVWLGVQLMQRGSDGLMRETFNGYIREPGADADPNVLEAYWDTTDLIERLRGTKISTPLYTNKRSDELIASILTLAGYTGDTNLDVGEKTFAYASWRKVSALDAIQEVVNSEIGTFVIDAEGRPAFFSRFHRTIPPAAVMALTTQTGMSHRQSADDIYNEAEVTCYPRVVGSSGTELWRWQEVPVTLTAGQTVTVEAEFTNGAGGAPCEASVVTTPVATTDYTAYTTPVSGGSDKTAQLSVTFTAYGRHAVIVMTNTDPATIYVRLFKIRGTPVTVPNSVTVRASDTTSQNTYHVTKTIAIDQPLETSAADAQDVAAFLAQLYANPIDRVQLKLTPKPSHIDALATLDLNDYVTLTNTNLGISAEGYFIDQIKMEMGDDAITREVTYEMSKPNVVTFIVLDSLTQSWDDVLGF